MGAMAVRPHEQIAEKAKEMEDAIYMALSSIDAYLGTLSELIAEQEASGEPNEMLVKRMKKFTQRGETMVKIIEDQVLAELMFCLDRVFSGSGSTVIVMLGQGIIAPVLPLYAADFGVSLTMIGVVLSAFALARMVLNTPLGLVADRQGRPPPRVAGTRLP